MKKIDAYDLVIFDCDGTLVDTEVITAEILVKMMKEIGIPMTHEECEQHFIGKNMLAITTHIQGQLPIGTAFDPSAFEKDYRQRMKIKCEESLVPLPGAIDLVFSVPCDICIASNGPREKMKVTLSITGLDAYFPEEKVFSAYDRQIWKPDPDLFIAAAEKSKIAPEKCLVIEDTIHGVIAAQKAGMDVVAVNAHNHKEEIESSQTPMFDDLFQVKAYLFDSE